MNYCAAQIRVFEDLYHSGGKDEDAFSGTSFTAKFHDRLYLVTAGHVVSDQSAQNLRVFDPVTAHSLPFKKFHPRKSSEDRDDLAVFEIETRMLGTEVSAVGNSGTAERRSPYVRLRIGRLPTTFY